MIQETNEIVAVKSVEVVHIPSSSSFNRELHVLRDLLQGGREPWRVEVNHDDLWVVAGEVPSDFPPASSSHSLLPASCLSHPNVLQLYAHYYTTDHSNAPAGQPGYGSSATRSSSLQLITSFLPTDVKRLKDGLMKSDRMTQCRKGGEWHIPLSIAKLILFQLARALAFLHSLHICHRDVKPSNLLIHPLNGRLQLCDLGSAKQIFAGENNTPLVCSRYYRAPELFFGSMRYGPAVDVWSFGCVAAELLRAGAKPIFRGRTDVDQLAEIFKALGTPSLAALLAMNPQCPAALQMAVQSHFSSPGAGELPYASGDDGVVLDGEVDEETAGAREEATRSEEVEGKAEDTSFIASLGPIGSIPRRSWEKMLGSREDGSAPVDGDTVELLSRLLCYDPQQRWTMVEVLQLPFFEDLFTSTEQQQAPLRFTTSSVDYSVFAVAEAERSYLPAKLVERMERVAEHLQSDTVRRA